MDVRTWKPNFAWALTIVFLSWVWAYGLPTLSGIHSWHVGAERKLFDEAAADYKGNVLPILRTVRDQAGCPPLDIMRGDDELGNSSCRWAHEFGRANSALYAEQDDKRIDTLIDGLLQRVASRPRNDPHLERVLPTYVAKLERISANHRGQAGPVSRVGALIDTFGRRARSFAQKLWPELWPAKS